MTTRRPTKSVFVSLVAAAVGAMLCAAALVGFANGAGATRVQNPGPSTAPGVTTEATPATVHNLGDGVTTVPPTTAAKNNSTLTKNATVRTTSRDSNRVWAVVAALILVALALTVLTVLYVRHTRPGAVEARPSVLDGGAAPAAAVSARPRGRSVPEPAGRR